MSDEDETTTSSFDVGEVVWVKLGVQWWPGEVYPEDQVPTEVRASHKKPPVAIVKFFHEDTYEFVKNANHILRYNHPKKMEFIRKGMDIVRQNNNKYMNKFPSDIQTAEEATGGDVNILNSIEFGTTTKKLNYSTIFGDQTKKTNKKGGKSSVQSHQTQSHRGRRRKSFTMNQQTTTPIMVSPPTKHVTPRFSSKNLDKSHESRIIPQKTLQTSPNASPGTYKCHLCDFTSTRQNVIVLHAKIHTSSTPLVSTKPIQPKSILKKPYRVESLIVIDDSDSDGEEQQQPQQQASTHNKSSPRKHVHEKNNDNEKAEKLEVEHNKRSESRNKRSTPQNNKKSIASKPTSSGRRSRLSPQQTASSSSDDVQLVTIEIDDTSTSNHSTLLPHEKKKTEKHDSIRSKLLADWSDDDDDENDGSNKSFARNDDITSTTKKRQSTASSQQDDSSTRAPTRLEMPVRLSSSENDELVELIKQSNLSNSSMSSSSSNLDATTILQQMSTKTSTKTMVASSSSANTTISTPKYRNIPKKDRRDIVLKDFDSSVPSSRSSIENNENMLVSKDNEITTKNLDISKMNDVEINNPNDEFSSSSTKHDQIEQISTPSKEVPPLKPETTESQAESNENVIESSEKCSESEVVDTTTIQTVAEEINENVNEKLNSTPLEDLPTTKDEQSSSQKKSRFSIEKQKETTATISEKSQSVGAESGSATVSITSNKSSISCFDFREDDDDVDEEDFLASISKLKKKYLSPEKNRDLESTAIVTDAVADDEGSGEQVQEQQQLSEKDIKKKLELEKKDKQLTDDIENLLNTTQLPEIANIDDNLSAKTTATTTPSSTILPQEVRTLPPKERGKRIFKSRNRSRYEEPTTSSITLSSSIATQQITADSSKRNDSTDSQQKVAINAEIPTSDETVKETTESVSNQNIDDDLTKTVNEIECTETNSVGEKIIERTAKGSSPTIETEKLQQKSETESAPAVTKVASGQNEYSLEITRSHQLNDDESKKESVEIILTVTTGGDVNKEEDNMTSINLKNHPNNRDILLDSNYRNELAVAETLISIPSKLNELESMKSEQIQQHQQQQQNNQETITNSSDDVEVKNNLNEYLSNDSSSQATAAEAVTEVTAIVQQTPEEKSSTQPTTALEAAPAPAPAPAPQRKRRAHMKITPRKRIIQESPTEASALATRTSVDVIQKDQQNITDPQNAIVATDNSRQQQLTSELGTESEHQPLTTESQEEKLQISENKRKKSITSEVAAAPHLSSDQLFQNNDDDGDNCVFEQSSTSDNFVEKYIKDAMMFVDDADDTAALQQQQQQPEIKEKDDDVLGNNDETREVLSPTVERKRPMDESSEETDITEEKKQKVIEECNESSIDEDKMKLTSKQVTEILDLRSMGMRADTPKLEIDNVIKLTTKSIISATETIKDTITTQNDVTGSIVDDILIKSGKLTTKITEEAPKTIANEEISVTMTTNSTQTKQKQHKQQIPGIIETKDETNSSSTKDVTKSSRRKSRELMNLLQSVDVGAGRNRSPSTLDSDTTEIMKEMFILQADKFESEDDHQKKTKQQQLSPTKEIFSGGSLRSFRPRKAKENIGVRIRASLSPPLAPAESESTSTTAPPSQTNNNSGLYLELIQAQKSSSLKDVIKSSKIESQQQQQHRLSQSDEQHIEENVISVEHNSQQQQQQQQQKEVGNGSSRIELSQGRKNMEITQHTITPTVSDANLLTVESMKTSKCSDKFSKSRQKSIVVIGQNIVVEPSKGGNIQSDIHDEPITKDKQISARFNIKRGTPNIISSSSEVVPSLKSPTKLQQQQQQQQRQSIPATSTAEVHQMKFISVPEQQQKIQQIILTTTTDSKAITAISNSTSNIVSQNKHKTNSSNIMTVENKHETVRVPKKRKPAFDDIEDIPSFVIQKRPTLSSPVPDKHQSQQQKPELAKKSDKIVTTKKEIIEIQQQQQQQQSPLKVICKATTDDTAMFDINSLPILLTSDTVLHSGDTNMNQVHIVITPHSNQSSSNTSTVEVISSEGIPLSSSVISSPLSSAPITTTINTPTTMLPLSTTANKSTVGAKKKTLKQFNTPTNNQTSHDSGNNNSKSATKTKQQPSKLLIQDEPKQIGIDGKGNKFVIVRSENGAKMIIQPDTPVKSKRKESSPATTIVQSTSSNLSPSIVPQSRKTTQSSAVPQQQQQQQQQPTFQQHQSTTTSVSSKNIGSTSEKASVISSQIISPTAGKHILSKATAGPTIQVGSDSNLVITSKGNVYSSGTTKQLTTIATGKNTADSRSIQSNVSVTQICNMSTASAAAASSLTRRLSRQGTTLQPVTGDRIARQQTVVEEPPKIIIQQKTIVDEICSPSVQLIQQQQQQPQQLEPGEISASEAAELTSRFGFIEVQQVQSPPETPEPSVVASKKFEATTMPIKHVQQHKTSRKVRNKSEEMTSAVSKFTVAEVPPLVALNDGQVTQQQQQTPRTSVKRKNISSSAPPQVAQQAVQTVNKPTTKSIQAVQLSGNTAAPSIPSPLPSPEKVVCASSTLNVAATTATTSPPTSSNLSKKINDNQKLLAVPGESFGGPPGSFYLCTSEKEGYVPVDNIPLFLDANNQLIPIQSEPKTIIDDGTISLQDTQVIVETGEGGEHILTELSQLGDGTNQFLLNTEDGQQIILDQQSLLALAANSANGSDTPQFITVDGQQLILTSDVLTAAVNQSGDLSGPILLSETIDGQLTTSNPDILAAALAGTEVYHHHHPDQLLQIDNGGNVLQIETSNGIQIVEQGGITFQPMNQSVTAQTSETNAILTQPPIMSTLEVPSSKKKAKLDPTIIAASKSINETGLIGQNLDDSLAVIGVTTQSSSTVPSSLNLPITVTNPAIAPKTSSNPITLSGIYPPGVATSTASSGGLGGGGQGSQISPTLSIGGANEQELVAAAGYELFTTSAIDSHQSGLVNCDDDKGIVITSTDDHHQQQSTGEEEIIMTDFGDEAVVAATTGHHHHHHSREFVVQQSQHNFDDSTNNR